MQVYAIKKQLVPIQWAPTLAIVSRDGMEMEKRVMTTTNVNLKPSRAGLAQFVSIKMKVTVVNVLLDMNYLKTNVYK